MSFFLNRKLKSVYLRLRLQSTASRNVLKLAGGAAGSQVITVGAAPILTRLYGPESFGVMATFVSILALLNVVSTLRYELAIAVPEEDEEAVALVWLCLALVVTSTGLIALGVLVLGDYLVVWLNEPSLNSSLWLLPAGVLVTGLYQPLSYWSIRRKQFGLLAQTKFRQSIYGTATQLAAASLGTIGLPLGHIVSQSAGAVAIFRHSSAELLRCLPSSPTLLLRTFRRYSHFGIYSSPSGLINIVANYAPILLFSSMYGSFYLGQLLVAKTVLFSPVSVISTSIGKVFLQKISEANRQDAVKSIFLNATKKMIFFLFPIILLLGSSNYLLSGFVFGRNWAQVGVLSLFLFPLILAQAVVSSTGQILFALGKTRLQLSAQILFAIVSLLPFTIFGLYSFEFPHAVLVWSLFNSMGYIIFWLLCFEASKKSIPIHTQA